MTFIGISYVDGLSFTRKALTSLGRYASWVRLVDCADNGPTDFGTLGDVFNGVFPPTIIRPTVPLFHTQVYNYFRMCAIEHGCKYYFQMHNDAEASEDAVKGLINLHSQLKSAGRKVGVIFTNYDAFALYDTECMKAIGGWDNNLTSYYSDNDTHRRMTLAGYELIDSGIPVKHYGSHIIKINAKRKWMNHNVLFDLYRAYYLKKWNGDPGKETFTRPFNGECENFAPEFTEKCE